MEFGSVYENSWHSQKDMLPGILRWRYGFDGIVRGSMDLEWVAWSFGASN